ncbi:phosphohydrolase [Pandoraea iniqua]|uniref:Phosphohydrolase n=1 Tax=Pandoraea iniqua TaxID=2508288 RepID=A0A5E4ZDV4_9BURK|nr:HD domain-containing protein [Pandoraea iniqua]VVE58373.1 phosphohydrolase [Pandoraea iniqua]
MSLPDLFAPCSTTVAEVLRHYDGGHATDDGAHDVSHLARVWCLAKEIAADVPGVDLEALAVATLLHDCVSVEKNSPDRARASTLAADVARKLLVRMEWPAARVERVAHAIAAHSFSAGITPTTDEARILRDADRLDALGAVGIARVFYVAGRLGSRLYDPVDPFAQHRELDDATYAIDHFERKLLHLTDGLSTAAGQRIGRERTDVMRAFLAQVRRELGLA